MKFKAEVWVTDTYWQSLCGRKRMETKKKKTPVTEHWGSLTFRG